MASPDLHTLIITKNWSAAIDRVQSHPHEIKASSTQLNYARGHYTALHSLIAGQHPVVRGQAIVPVAVARAILMAADAIDYVTITDGNTDATMSDEIRAMSGSWRLLLDQNNRARWSPLHLLCVQGELPLLKVLLQRINEDEDDHNILQYQRKVLMLVDRQERNILHLLLNIDAQSEESLEAVEFIVALCPALSYQRDDRYMTPLEYLLDRMDTNAGLHRRHISIIDTGLCAENYKMLCLLVSALEQDVRTRITRGEENNHFSHMTESRTDTNNIQNYYPPTAKNALHAACIIPWSMGPSDGSLIKNLALSRWKVNGVVLGDGRVMAKEKDSNGNLALHLFVSNMSYSNYSMANCPNHLRGKRSRCNLEVHVMQILMTANPFAVFTPNKDNHMLPLQLAMKSGRRYAMALLVMKYPAALHADESISDIKLFGHLLSCLSDKVVIKNQEARGQRQACLSTIFQLLRARPDIVSLQSFNDRVSRDTTWR